MTDQQINAAIAQACGIMGKDEYGPLYQTSDGWVVDCPNFATDLNAMHEAENWLSPIDRDHYIDTLGDMFDSAWAFALADARSRAEAFLKTLGKWEGS